MTSKREDMSKEENARVHGELFDNVLPTFMRSIEDQDFQVDNATFLVVAIVENENTVRAGVKVFHDVTDSDILDCMNQVKDVSKEMDAASELIAALNMSAMVANRLIKRLDELNLIDEVLDEADTAKSGIQMLLEMKRKLDQRLEA